MVELRTEDKARCQAWHIAANKALAHTWQPPTDNYAGDALYNAQDVIVSVEPLCIDGLYVFPLMDNTELFLKEGVLTQEDIEQFATA